MLFYRTTETISGVSRRLVRRLMRAGLVLALLAWSLPAGAFLDLPEIEITPSEDGNYADNHPACRVADWQEISDEQVRIWAVQLNSQGRLNAPICQPFGETLLHLVVESASLETIDWLLLNGANANVMNVMMCSPICRALFWGRADVAVQLHSQQNQILSDQLEVAVEHVLTYGDANKIRPFMEIITAQGFRLTPYHMALALRNADASMTGLLLDLGMSPDTVVPTRFGGPPTQLSAMEYALLYAPDTRVFKLLWDRGVTPNLSGQLPQEGYWSFADLVHNRNVVVDYTIVSRSLLKRFSRAGASFSECMKQELGNTQFCSITYRQSISGGRNAYARELARRYESRLPDDLETEDENIRYPLEAEEITNKEGVIYATQRRS